jgi:hypothetical protein
MRRVVLIAALSCLAGCAEFSRTPFDPAAVAWAKADGKAKIVGTLDRSRLRGSPNEPCTGRDVQLIPASKYTRDLVDSWVGKAGITIGPRPEPPPIGSAPYRERYVRCDRAGNFEFVELPAGDWIVFYRVVLDMTVDPSPGPDLYLNIGGSKPKPGQQIPIGRALAGATKFEDEMLAFATTQQSGTTRVVLTRPRVE